jgi:DNA modification methylase
LIYLGDCLEVLKTLEENSVDALVTDPPYGWNFMGKGWDKVAIEKRVIAHRSRSPIQGWHQSGKARNDDPAMEAGRYDQTIKGNQAFQEWTRLWAIEALRVLKPGGHALIFCGPRTYHRMASGVEDAGFEIRDQLQWLFGSGFPKSHNIGKATQDPKWEGWGTGLKPANEPILLARKPISEKTIAANVLKWGCGGLNIDASRIGTQAKSFEDKREVKGNDVYGKFEPAYYDGTKGRFPANLILSHNPDCVEVGTKKVKNNSGSVSGKESSVPGTNTYGEFERIQFNKHSDEDGTETVTTFECTPGCAVTMLDAQSGNLKQGVAGKNSRPFGDGKIFGTAKEFKPNNSETYACNSPSGASRFFYCAKASKKDRNAGCEGMPKRKLENYDDGSKRKLIAQAEDAKNPNLPRENTHPTVKSTILMSYLINLVTPRKGIVLDPFMGSGSTGVAAIRDGFQFIGVEKEKEYFEIAQKRIEHEQHKD